MQSRKKNKKRFELKLYPIFFMLLQILSRRTGSTSSENILAPKTITLTNI